jgi:protein-tyrosine phosphatase
MYQIADALYVGPFASPVRLPSLRRAQITHLLNVSEAPSMATVEGDGFREVAWHPVMDLTPIAATMAVECLETLHRMVCEPDARVYVHCIAGQNRSPTIVWLYYVACGFAPETARDLIERRVPDAVPGHSVLISTELLQAVLSHGKERFLPHPCESALQPFGLSD